MKTLAELGNRIYINDTDYLSISVTFTAEGFKLYILENNKGEMITFKSFDELQEALALHYNVEIYR